ncbi:MAG: hypothetical protein HYV94_18150, partial [Candidatus Rokubacteria bacterium]|nr:hypothetical protein [Candidatus Rokubacteria bacterium]
MSTLKDLKRQLETACEAIDALDADLSAGRLGLDEHGRQRAEREREAGRLSVSIRRAQREARGRPAEPPVATAGAGRLWHRNPLVMVPAAMLLIGGGVGAGVAGLRWFAPAPAGPPATAPAAPAAPAASMTEIELQALRQVAAR